MLSSMSIEYNSATGLYHVEVLNDESEVVLEFDVDYIIAEDRTIEGMIPLKV
jgi:hypothetical protein